MTTCPHGNTAPTTTEPSCELYPKAVPTASAWPGGTELEGYTFSARDCAEIAAELDGREPATSWLRRIANDSVRRAPTCWQSVIDETGALNEELKTAIRRVTLVTRDVTSDRDLRAVSRVLGPKDNSEGHGYWWWMPTDLAEAWVGVLGPLDVTANGVAR